ncbi:ABC transporter permease [Pelagicoccus sp. SDUM812002]|uniref:ABC transporter permease n=1 Tax=Pelagicoccus sp. SDUM812002 TaxID=3041266 RepID=UPI00280E4083|nr:ABC transporter permease [Pelagicoccus sp. SDUM812002]MDQ8184816.1 ABC transporter permease [Pelagicoccus sp. SDUM812002]
MLNDLRFGLRQLTKSPGFTFITVLTLAIGIGASTAIFSLVNAYFLKPLPFEESHRLIALRSDEGQGPTLWRRIHGKLVQDIETNSSQLESVIGITGNNANLALTGIDIATMLQGRQVTGPLLKTLGLNPTRGQDFTADHQSATGDDKVVLLSEKVWKQHLFSVHDIVGKSIILGQQNYTVIGLYDEEQLYLGARVSGNDFMIPAAIPKTAFKRDEWNYYVIGRLAPEASLHSASQEFESIKSQFANTYPEIIRESKIDVWTLQDAIFLSYGNITFLLLAAVGLVLLIACANVANLLFARLSARQSELALRTAIGASGWRIVRLLLCESALLSLAGAIGGLLICINALPLLEGLLSTSNWPDTNLIIDFRVLAFTLVASVGTGLLFGVSPALKALRQGASQGLGEMNRSFTRSRGNKLQAALIVSEIALSVVLLVSIGLLLKSTNKAFNADRGFDESNVFNFEVWRQGNLGPDVTPEQARQARTRFSRELIGRLKQIPGVESAAMISQPPMDYRGGVWKNEFLREDQSDAPRRYLVSSLQINGDVFSILDIPLIRGRVFDERDQLPDSHEVAVIDELLAKEQFSDIDPIGQSIRLGGQTYEVVGIVGSIVPRALDRGKGSIVYTPQIHWPWNTNYIIETRLKQNELEGEVQDAIKSLDPDQPIGELTTLKQIAENTQNFRSVLNILFVLFGSIAIFLAGFGIYGLMTNLVEQRYREIGIRLAIGALPNEIIGMIFKRGLRLTSIGVGIGIVAVLLLGRFLSFMLYQVTPYDPVILASVCLFVVLVSAFACWRPARSATKIHPTEALQLA